MTVLALHFPWRRYHATPWGRYMNEGAVEVPPSPWRLLRALYSVWKLRVPELAEDTVHDLLCQLALPPVYALPPYHLSHSRHYLPDTQHRSGAASTDLAIDAYAILGGDATIRVIWPSELLPAQNEALSRLTASLPYLGRADSLCDARLDRDWTPGGERLAVPLDLSDEPADQEAVSGLLSPELPLDFTALVARPSDIRAGRLLYPPGSRQVPYVVPGPERPRPRSQRAARQAKAPAVVRLSLTGTPTPRAQDLVTITDATRAACVNSLTGIRDGQLATSLLAGKDHAGQPLTGHQHAHFLPITANSHLTGLAIWVPGGLHEDELLALTRLAGRTIGAPEGVPGPRDLYVRLTAHGGPELLPAALTGPAASWVSATPFIPTHHRGRNQDNTAYLRAEIERELAYRQITSPVSITPVSRPELVVFTRHRFTPHRRPGKTVKTAGNRNEHGPAYAARIDFSEPVQGPLSLGTLSHFGLGLFEPAHT